MRRPVLSAVGLVFVGWTWAGAEGFPPAPVRIGNSEKICQLTGETDWENGRPTAGRTFSNFGLDATDLGYPVEHNGKLILLFGDSWPPPHGGEADPELPPDDAVGSTTRADPPGEDGKCLELRINENPLPQRTFAPATIVALPRVRQGFFNVPSGGVSAQGELFAFFWTNHCARPNRLGPSPELPLARPAPGPSCPESDERSSIGRNVLARSSDDGRTFRDPVAMPPGFVYATAVNAQNEDTLATDQKSGVFVFGVPRYRASVPYLALAPRGTLGHVADWRFFAGRGDNGAPRWVPLSEWARAPDAAHPASWRPPGGAEIFLPETPAARCVGEFSVTWNPALRDWLMVYQCAGEVVARIAPAPWGPWSPPTRILGPDDRLGCRLLMVATGCGQRRDFWPERHQGGAFVAGGLYAPFVLNRYTTAANVGYPGRGTTIYWIVSTWNPYEVTVMRTTLAVSP